MSAEAPATLATHRPLRLFSLCLLYVAQGVPEGLLYVAVPAWLAAQGTPPEAIGTYIAIILLPWSLKLINGVVMDRVTFLPMGRRRPWLLAAQASLVLTLVAFGAQAPEADDLTYLIIVGFLVNLAGAFQDVAIDGMAVDIVPEHERARANGLMWGGKTLGIAGASIVTGLMITHYGYAAAALATAGFVLIVMTLPLLLRERPNERLLPWTHGEASAEALDRQIHGWRPLGGALWQALSTAVSLVFAAGILVAFMSYGLQTAFAPPLAVQELGWSSDAYSSIAGYANMAGAVFGMLAAGVIAERLGTWQTLLLALAGLAVLTGGMATVPDFWAAPGVFTAFKVVYALLFVLMSVSLYAGAMALCSPAVAATQFSVYMAILNFGTSLGAQQLGAIQGAYGYSGAFAGAAFASVIGMGVFALAWITRRSNPSET